jgi:hypothetical protein
VQLWGSWTMPLVVTATVYVIGGVLTLLVNPHQRLALTGGDAEASPGSA